MRIGKTYEYTRNAKDHDNCVFIVLTVIGVIASLYTLYGSFHSFSKYRDYSASLSLLNLQYSDDPIFHPENNGGVVHVSIPQNDLIFARNIYDPYFNVEVPGAVTLNREVEYCQWAEHVHETTRKVDNENERVTRTYTYTKYWRSHLINSLFFDQPAAHFNPQRNPVSGGHVDSVGVSSRGGFSVDAKFMQKLKGDSSIISFRPESLQRFVGSAAYINDKFFYTGNNGWFLSKYEPSAAETVMKMAFQYVEGTLLDFQLGDLFSVCDAGDIRVRLEGKVLQDGLSVIAEQKTDGSLVPFKSLSGSDIIIIRSGQVDADTMIAEILSDKKWSVIYYVIGFIISAALSALFIAILNNEAKKSKNQ